jgi:hypothetical protein
MRSKRRVKFGIEIQLRFTQLIANRIATIGHFMYLPIQYSLRIVQV